MDRKKKISMAFVCALALLLAGCQTSSETGSKGQGDSAAVGKITSIDGTVVKLQLGTLELPEDGERLELPEGEKDGERLEPPEGEKDGERPELPEGEKDGERPEFPEGEKDGERPELPEGETGDGMHRGGRFQMFKESGETMSLDLAHVTILIEGTDGISEKGSPDELKVGDILELKEESGEVQSVTVRRFQGRQRRTDDASSDEDSQV